MRVEPSSDEGGLTQDRANRSNLDQVIAKPINTFESDKLNPAHGHA
jgi:hypothetical protein